MRQQIFLERKWWRGMLLILVIMVLISAFVTISLFLRGKSSSGTVFIFPLVILMFLVAAITFRFTQRSFMYHILSSPDEEGCVRVLKFCFPAVEETRQTVTLSDIKKIKEEGYQNLFALEGHTLIGKTMSLIEPTPIQQADHGKDGVHIMRISQHEHGRTADGLQKTYHMKCEFSKETKDGEKVYFIWKENVTISYKIKTAASQGDNILSPV